VSRLPKESAVTRFYTHEEIVALAKARAPEIIIEALALHPRPAEGLGDSVEAARREIESRLREHLDVLELGRLSPYWRELVIRADEFLPRPCAGCGAPVWPGTRFGTPVFRCDDCWRALVIGARLVARAETPAEIQAGLRMVWPRLD
jgi:DNA-directed RNA polymerase subunit K/omega